MPAFNESFFCSEFVREYLRYCMYDKSTLSGWFVYRGRPVHWGAVAEFGPPPTNGLLVEIWSEQTKRHGDTATFRFWHNSDKSRGGVYPGKTIMRQELTDDIESSTPTVH